jgi:hypothetical protein
VVAQHGTGTSGTAGRRTISIGERVSSSSSTRKFLQVLAVVGCLTLVATLPITSVLVGAAVYAVGVGYRLLRLRLRLRLQLHVAHALRTSPLMGQR